ncbi:MAG: hypothetical protein WBQ18_09810 [Solirubrobacteraceae bacterium]
MTDAWHSLKLKRFERVDAVPSVALLRITGKGPRRSPAIGDRPTLAADDGESARRFAPIPAPPDEDRALLRAAYSVPDAAITPNTVFSLEFADGAVIPLPAPAPGEARVPVTRPEAGEPEPRPGGTETKVPAAVDAERRADLLSKLAQLSGALADAERSIGEHSTARIAAEADAEAARTEIRHLNQRLEQLASEAAESGELLDNLQARLADAEHRARTADERVAAAIEESEQRARTADERVAAAIEESEQRVRTALQDADARAAEGQGAIAGRAEEAIERAEAAALELLAARELGEAAEQRYAELYQRYTELAQRNQELEQGAGGHQETVRGLELDLMLARESVSPLELEMESLRTSRAQQERELHDALDSVRKMTIERDEAGRQAAAFDAVAIKARERATQAEEAYEKQSAVLSELETWRGELERRLASMSAELGAARARIKEDERHIAGLRAELVDARARVGDPAGTQPNGGPEGGPSAAQMAEIEALSARAELLAAEQAARELSDPTQLER